MPGCTGDLESFPSACEGVRGHLPLHESQPHVELCFDTCSK